MNRDFESSAWAASHGQLSNAIATLFDKAAYAFERLRAIEYDAPWERTAARRFPKREHVS